MAADDEAFRLLPGCRAAFAITTVFGFSYATGCQEATPDAVFHLASHIARYYAASAAAGYRCQRRRSFSPPFYYDFRRLGFTPPAIAAENIDWPLFRQP